MRLLTVANPKTRKGETRGYVTAILHLAPHTAGGGKSLCTSSTEGCREDCLMWQGRGGMWSKATGDFLESTERIHRARIRRTERYWNDRAGFLSDLRKDVSSLTWLAARMRAIPAVRLNGMSDLPSLALQMAAEFPDVQFYDYTKHAKAWLRRTKNYHLTFSRSESNETECTRALEHGVNVAVVFKVAKSKPLPATYLGRRVIDGDVSDLRFLDPTGVVVGVRAKGTAKQNRTGFVVTP
jgi:hypothetical protein